ncbi:MAG: 16S rRNA (cytidine(1402)-2'-O)-methyltransferase [Candidatus Omnitrophica bacterium]|nr:16S rRNA (cytidine(1402)-2'-O)-methyltransferase [Candidatus Omnitrophota bacterium]MBU1128705.1 16S rRNA (cytidine(1402)-2'-O)-methyltransferase [Candidatus Omnitrophota bacterium]MBU1657257.1 16S rRNA (cytidine(1402)-2'-O)-methyltransferase [Candidatus Omnitrophota bacterium]MBU1784820.1 16S rRNA (cytidine(1402)-2'-O)-methyltransferase [Candidatus Omnitrophota bacterium]MBU1850982.1 16S rRNA (cytidine(1402)-2'-O)-methyltransferase [Candidatus Omnitrophota bacterium]
MAGTLSIVSTPIGNIEDITLRAIRTLKEADIIAAEDTRHTKKLLNAYRIDTPLTSFHSYNNRQKSRTIIKMLKEGKNVALVSDSGTPGISDPGHVLIKGCIDESLPATVIPGPTALVAALVLSGKPANKFVFEGFLSSKGARRKKQLKELLTEERTVIVYESPHRIEKLLIDIKDIDPARTVVLARELTKKFEEVKHGTAEEHLGYFAENKPRGEFIVLF